MPIDVDNVNQAESFKWVDNEDNQWKHDSEFVKITKNIYDTCFISNFSREID